MALAAVAAAATMGCAALCAGCRTSLLQREAERKLESRLGDLLGPADHYRVRIRRTPNGDLVRGRVRRLEANGTGVFARRQIHLESLALVLDEVRYDGTRPFLVSIGRSELSVTFTERAFNDYLQLRHARYDPVVGFEDGTVRVRITYPFLGKPTVIRAVGRLVVQDQQRLVFDADSVDTSFLNAPRFGEKFVEDRVNPLLDLARIGFPARLEGVDVLRGRVRARGVAVIPPETPDADVMGFGAGSGGIGVCGIGVS